MPDLLHVLDLVALDLVDGADGLAVGADDFHVALSLNQVAEIYAAQGRYADAELLYALGQFAEAGEQYERVAAAIRCKDPGAILFVEGVIHTNAGIDTWLPQPTFDNFAYAPHFYDTPMMLAKRYLGPAQSTVAYFTHARRAAKWNVPLFITTLKLGAALGAAFGGSLAVTTTSGLPPGVSANPLA